MEIMESRMTLDKLEVARTRRYFIDSSGTKEKNSSHTGIHLGLILDTDIKWTTKIIG